MPRFAANLSLLFNEVDFLERFAHAVRYSFSAVEFMYPYDLNGTDIKAAAIEAGLPIALFNAPVGETFGFAALVELEEFKVLMQPALDYAATLRPEKMHILSGLAEADDHADTRYATNIGWIAAELAKLDVLAVIEPINSYSIPGYFLNNLEQAFDLIKKINHPNVKILFDIFHIQQIHGDLLHQLQKVASAGLLGHVQVAAVPHRHEPGSGEVNEAFIFQALDELGYGGYIGAEYNPAGATTEGLGWLDNHVSTP